ncbi:dienelactone hydrolase family protein [Diaphorobacter aerolatus]|uniref:Dienelactone hydrolase domain-containing protein n=1 Tax=Diaphorobacter aerolatus TaxID=1288495 RepID=A0A7H0GHC2_9BURK|nr:hypothetical protein [Diaphorobacter aerolatus]QNP47688.1 hypothetical protein H9K75_16010 [Diaphorobacter aerolatus]
MPVTFRHPHRPLLALVAGMLCCAPAASVWAGMQERVLQVPVSVTSPQGTKVNSSIAVTVYSDAANPVPAPVLVLNHGRSPQAEGRKELHRARFAKQARYFVSRGFLVAVPTRLGYGPTFEDDAEDSGACKSKRFAPALNSAATQINAVLDAVRHLRADASPDRAVIAGQSFGGAAAVAAAAQEPHGVQAVINFAGGAGGNPARTPASLAIRCSLRACFAATVPGRSCPCCGSTRTTTSISVRSGPPNGTPPSSRAEVTRSSSSFPHSARMGMSCSVRDPGNGSRWCRNFSTKAVLHRPGALRPIRRRWMKRSGRPHVRSLRDEGLGDHSGVNNNARNRCDEHQDKQGGFGGAHGALSAQSAPQL